MGRNSKYYGIRFDHRSRNFGFHVIARSQLIADNHRWSQTIAEVCFHMIAANCRTFCDLWSMICDRLWSYGNQLLFCYLLLLLLLILLFIIVIIISTELLALCDWGWVWWVGLVAGLRVGQAFGVLLLPGFGVGSSSPRVPGHPTSMCDSGVN